MKQLKTTTFLPGFLASWHCTSVTKVLDPSLCLVRCVSHCIVYCNTLLEQKEDSVHLRPEDFQFTLDLCSQGLNRGTIPAANATSCNTFQLSSLQWRGQKVYFEGSMQLTWTAFISSWQKLPKNRLHPGFPLFEWVTASRWWEEETLEDASWPSPSPSQLTAELG